jgi:thiol:disulfide interchange protein DsbD
MIGTPLAAFSLLGLAVVVAWPALATASPGSNVVQTDHVTAQLIPEELALVPGRRSAIALRLVAIPHWHTYWRNPGDSGLPTSIHWQLPDQTRVGEIQWPTPERLPVGPLVNFGYEGEAWLITDLELPAAYPLPSATIIAKAKWLACNDICIPEIGEFALILPVHMSATPSLPNSEAAAGFAQARARLPATGKVWHPVASSTANGAKITIQPPVGTERFIAAYYFPYDEGLVEASLPQALTVTGDELYSLDIPRAEQPAGRLNRINGVVAFDTSTRGRRSVEIDVPIEGTGAAEARADTAGGDTPRPAGVAPMGVIALIWTLLVMAGASAFALTVKPKGKRCHDPRDA